MENHTSEKDIPSQSIGREFTITITLAGLALAFLVGLLCYSLYRRQAVHAAGETALAIAKTLAVTIDGDKYSETMEKEEQDTFWDNIRSTIDKIHDNTEATFVYAISQGTAEHYKYFAAGTNDVGIGLARHKELFAREVEKTLLEGELARSWIYESGADPFVMHKSIVSGFAPIRDSKNAVVGAVGVDMGVDEALGAARTALYILLASFAAFATGMVTFLLWRAKKSIIRPLEAITIASGKLANGETELPELPVDRNDEIGLLARHFNQVARSVNSLTVGFIGTADSQSDRAPTSSAKSKQLKGSHVPTAGLSGKYLATAQGINMVLTILDTLDGMVYVVDPETLQFIFYSQKFGEHFGIDNEKAWTMKCWEAIGYKERCPACGLAELGLANVSYPSCEHEEFDEKTQTWLWVKSWLIHWFDGRVVFLSENRDIGETKRWQEKQAAQEQQLRQTTQAAEEANQMKTAFLANMSHEIRTPLNGVIGFAELAMDEPGTPEKTRTFLKKITDSGAGLLQLINDILDVSKIETGKMEVETIPFEIHDLFALCETICQPKAIEKGIDLSFYEERLPNRQLVGDPTKLRQVLLNLIANALKFTSEGAVSVKCLLESIQGNKALLLFEVRDNGIGMTDEQLENVFQPFTQADGSITRKYGGTGLGLSISHSLVEIMGGELSVKSRPGVGSTFTFTAPVGILDVPIGSSRKAETTIIRSKPVFAGDALVCEDNQINREVIEEHLRRVGLRTFMAENGQVGVDMIRKRQEEGQPPFVIIFMDIHMPKMDGLEATKVLRKMNVWTPIIALTANVMATERERYIHEGMADCLGKPFTAKQLWKCLMRFLDPVRLEEEMIDQAAEYREQVVIDTGAGLAHAANNPDLYERQLQYFAREQQDFITKFDQAAGKDEKEAHRLVHTLKGISATIGAKALSEASRKMEDVLSGKVNVAPERFAALRLDMSKKLDAVLNHLRTRDALAEAEQIQGGAQAPANVETAASVKQLLIELLALLLANDSSALDLFPEVRAAEPMLGEDGSVLLAHLDEYDFDKAAKVTEQILEHLK